MPLQGCHAFVSTLLDWHQENGRHDLPWRESGRSKNDVVENLDWDQVGPS